MTNVIIINNIKKNKNKNNLNPALFLCLLILKKNYLIKVSIANDTNTTVNMIPLIPSKIGQLALIKSKTVITRSKSAAITPNALNKSRPFFPPFVPPNTLTIPTSINIKDTEAKDNIAMFISGKSNMPKPVKALNNKNKANAPITTFTDLLFNLKTANPLFLLLFILMCYHISFCEF